MEETVSKEVTYNPDSTVTLVYLQNAVESLDGTFAVRKNLMPRRDEYHLFKIHKDLFKFKIMNNGNRCMVHFSSEDATFNELNTVSDVVREGYEDVISYGKIEAFKTKKRKQTLKVLYLMKEE